MLLALEFVYTLALVYFGLYAYGCCICFIRTYANGWRLAVKEGGKGYCLMICQWAALIFVNRPLLGKEDEGAQLASSSELL